MVQHMCSARLACAKQRQAVVGGLGGVRHAQAVFIRRCQTTNNRSPKRLQNGFARGPLQAASGAFRQNK
eukprot:1340787-Alexandrium_andersonii.AAC.1